MRLFDTQQKFAVSGTRVMLIVALVLLTAAWALCAGMSAAYPLSEPLRYFEMTRTLAAFAVLFAVMYSVVWVTLVMSKHEISVSKSFEKRIVLCALTLVVVLAFVTLPIRSPDIFWTLAVAKGWVLHGVNPYVAAASTIGEHSWNVRAPFISGIVYGPAWVYLTGLVAKVTDSLHIAVALMKLTGVMCYVVGIACVAAIMKLRGVSEQRRTFLTVLLAFNPMLLQAGIVDVNNDIITFAAIAFAMLLFLRRSYLPSAAVLLLGGLVKYVPWLIIPVPLAWMIIERRWPSRRDVALFTFSAVLVVAAYVPLGAPALYGTQMRASFAEFTQPEMAMPGGWMLHQLSLSATHVRLVGVALTLIVMIWCIHKRYQLEVWLYPFAVLIFFGGMWVNPWYLLWLLPAATVLLGGWAVWLIGVTGILMPWFIHPLPLGALIAGFGASLCIGVSISDSFTARLRTLVREVS